MFCGTCQASTHPRWTTVRRIRVPVCSNCTPRHDGWWFCRCVECVSFRAANVLRSMFYPTHQWLRDYAQRFEETT